MMINEQREKYIERILSAVYNALEIEEFLLKRMHITTANKRIHTNGVSITYSDLNKKQIHSISRLLKITLVKAVSNQGFLKYIGYTKVCVKVVINTTECFYGGKPLVKSYPRTKAICPPKEDSSLLEAPM